MLLFLCRKLSRKITRIKMTKCPLCPARPRRHESVSPSCVQDETKTNTAKKEERLLNSCRELFLWLFFLFGLLEFFVQPEGGQLVLLCTNILLSTFSWRCFLWRWTGDVVYFDVEDGDVVYLDFFLRPLFIQESEYTMQSPLRDTATPPPFEHRYCACASRTSGAKTAKSAAKHNRGWTIFRRDVFVDVNSDGEFWQCDKFWLNVDLTFSSRFKNDLLFPTPHSKREIKSWGLYSRTSLCNVVCVEGSVLQTLCRKSHAWKGFHIGWRAVVYYL